MITKSLVLLFIVVTAHSQIYQISSGNAVTNPVPSGYTLWLHADDLTSLQTNGVVGPDVQTTQGERVGRWYDRATGTNTVFNSLADDTTRPILSNNWFNGKPALIFRRDTTLPVIGNAFLQSTGKIYNLGASTGITVMVCASYDNDNSGSFSEIFTWGDVADATDYIEFRRENDSTTMEVITDSGTDVNGVAGDGFGTNKKPHVYSFRYADNFGAITSVDGTNGVFGASSGTVFPMQDMFAIAHRVGGGNDLSWPGAISEVILWPWYLSSSEHAIALTYMTNKYNIPNP